MTEQFQQAPLAAISKVRQRVSKGGRPFAKPYLLDPQMQASRNHAANPSTIPTDPLGIGTRAYIRMQGLSGKTAENLLDHLMGQIGQISGVALRKKAGSGQLQPHEWLEDRNVGGDWCGDIQLEAESPAELQHIFSNVHGSGIEVNGKCYIVEVGCSSANVHHTRVRNIRHADAPEHGEAGNGSGGRVHGH